MHSYDALAALDSLRLPRASTRTVAVVMASARRIWEPVSPDDVRRVRELLTRQHMHGRVARIKRGGRLYWSLTDAGRRYVRTGSIHPVAQRTNP